MDTDGHSSGSHRVNRRGSTVGAEAAGEAKQSQAIHFFFSTGVGWSCFVQEQKARHGTGLIITLLILESILDEG